MKLQLIAILLIAVAFSGCQSPPTTQTHLAILFNGAQGDVAAVIPFDAGARPALAFYTEAGVLRPDAFTVHDQLESWSQSSGLRYEVQPFASEPSAGFTVISIAGVSPAATGGAWAVAVNGAEAALGLSSTLHAGDRVAWSLVADLPGLDAPGTLGLVVESVPPTLDAAVQLVGSVTGSARISIAATRAGETWFRQGLDANGAWTVNLVGAPFGRSNVTVTADDGTDTHRVRVMVVRMATATVTAEFASAIPQRAPINETILVDVDAFLSAPQYSGQPVEHPPFANVHDVMATWNLTRPIVFSFHPSFGAGVESIDGHGALSDWCYDVNGASAPLGITGMEFRPGDQLDWHGCVIM